MRTPATQARIYSQGRTTAGPVVSGTLQSKHLEGRAIDLAFTLDGRRLSQDGIPLIYWNTLGMLMKHLVPGVRWGGDWKSRDYGHFEI